MNQECKIAIESFQKETGIPLSKSDIDTCICFYRLGKIHANQEARSKELQTF